MPDYAGPLQRLVLTRTLWLVVAWPIVGLAWQALVVRRKIARAQGQSAMLRALASARNAGIACVALSAAATLAHVVVLVRVCAPAQGTALFEHIARGARFGQFDGEVDFLLDPLSATFCALASLVALGASVFIANGPPADRGWRVWAWLQLSLAGATIAFIADGFVGTAVGWSIAGAAGAWLAGWNHAGAGIVMAMRSAVAIAAMLLGAVLLFWGLGGSWEGDEYVPDPQPRFTAVHVGGWPEPVHASGTEGSSSGVEHASASSTDVPSAPSQHAQRADAQLAAGGGGSLTFTSMPGAVVFVDEARVPSKRSPFVGVPVRAGIHTLRVRPGDGSNDEILGSVAFDDAGNEIALIPLGPTLMFRAIADQLVLRDRQSETAVRSAVELRTGPGGATVVAASLVALLLAAGIMSGATPSGDTPPALGALAHGATTAGLGPYLLARTAFLFPLAPNSWVAVEAVGGAILLMAGWRAPVYSGLRRWLAFVGVAPAALACLALGAGGPAVAGYVMVLTGTATAAMYLAASRSFGPSRNRNAGSIPQMDVGRNGADAALDVHETVADLLLVHAPMRLGVLLVSMDRWVVGAMVETIAAFARLGAWVVANVDDHLVAAPANVVASRMVRMGRRIEPMIGTAPRRVLWALLAAVSLAVLADALRLER
ncbi:MAG: hypothetical protein M3O46_04435 [Myxococcota bacterium]|nr:hypothetical protein [Myxococcota bacterium]